MSTVMDSIRVLYDGVPQWAKVVIGGVVIAAPTVYYFYANQPRKSPLKADWKPGVVYLYQFPRINYIPSLSPYCLKLETWLRMADVNYENVYIELLGVRSSEGLLPFIELDGVEYADSAMIMDMLPGTLGKNTDSHLDSDTVAVGRAFEQMIANQTIFSYAYVRHTEFRDEFLSEKIMGTKLPLLMRIIPGIMSWAVVKKAQKKYIYTIGRHTPDEVKKIGERDLKAINDFLGDKQFFLGSKPSRVDSAIFFLLVQILYLPMDTFHKMYLLKSCPKLVEYTDRMKEAYWPDWDETIKTKKMDTKWKK